MICSKFDLNYKINLNHFKDYEHPPLGIGLSIAAISNKQVETLFHYCECVCVCVGLFLAKFHKADKSIETHILDL